MLIGQYEGKIGAKHQVSFPKKFRGELGDSLIVTKGLEKCLIVVSKENWKTLLEGTEGEPFTKAPIRGMQRFLLGNASEVALDGKGRFVLPDYLRDYAGLSEDIIFAGIQRFVEVWDKKAWETEQQALAGNIETISEKLAVQKDRNE